MSEWEMRLGGWEDYTALNEMAFYRQGNRSKGSFLSSVSILDHNFPKPALDLVYS